ncbi:MAG: glycosyltransferase family 2 protein [Terriglobia bacterium]
MIKISVVIVSWNTCHFLRNCLVSALLACRRLGQETEMIVVDNASSDGSVPMVTREFPEVRIIVNSTNEGFASATNQGILCSVGQYVLLLNPDTRPFESSLQVLVEFLDSHPEAGAAGPLLLGRSGDVQPSYSRFPTLLRELWSLFHLERFTRPSPTRMGDLHQPRQVEAIGGACLLVRRTVLEEIGLLDERFFIYSEEIDFCRRMFDAGWRIYWIPQAVVTHYGGESTRQVGTQMFLELYRSKIQYFRKHFGFGGASAYKVLLLFASIARLVASSILTVTQPSQRAQVMLLARNYGALLRKLCFL